MLSLAPKTERAFRSAPDRLAGLSALAVRVLNAVAQIYRQLDSSKSASPPLEPDAWGEARSWRPVRPLGAADRSTKPSGAAGMRPPQRCSAG